ncbi:cysteine proteinase inhibitor A-like [Benincasa hispida]|uniref:cysteine proteinase inhibitor A-like n=1 Tax=Benincasa hispida TaxID=102211 RepID=UPI0019026BDF|nr:cysteine proteinase inhibitor A-like [Benincasa hispida]
MAQTTSFDKKIQFQCLVSDSRKAIMKVNRIAVALLLLLLAVFDLGFSVEDPFIRMKLGGVRDYIGAQNSVEIDYLARFAVQEHNKKENGLLEFERVLKAKEQVIAGKLYHLTLEAIDGGKKKVYEAKVWVKPWMNFKQLQEFKLCP